VEQKEDHVNVERGTRKVTCSRGALHASVVLTRTSPRDSQFLERLKRYASAQQKCLACARAFGSPAEVTASIDAIEGLIAKLGVSEVR
jgi:hypothetical protein